MSGIIQGYEYDIFISYRQKDNKYDGWVTEFADNLRKELEATFKEEISIYFDENPQDGILETYKVDKSLENKIKSLIFIPVISQTYCDPKSFAWKNEFIVFNRTSGIDLIGSNIRLSNGNVSGRILPVRIHELDEADKSLLESELGGLIRSVDFIFKSAGVNRPLKPNDSRTENLYHTYYRDQINKVANAVKEIITAIKKSDFENNKKLITPPASENPKGRGRILSVLNHSKTTSIIISSMMLITLVIIIYLYFPNLRRKDDGRISIAVMPFQNLTNDTTLNDWEDGIREIMVNTLTNAEELKVRQIDQFRNPDNSGQSVNYGNLSVSDAGSISKKMDVKYIVFGSINLANQTLLLNARLFDARKNEVFKSFRVDGSRDQILHLTDSISSKITNTLEILNFEKGETPDFRSGALVSDVSPEAFKYYLLGKKSFFRRDYPEAVKLFTKASEIDTTFYLAMRFLIYSYGNQGLYEEAKKWCLKVYNQRDHMSLQQQIWVNLEHTYYFETPLEGLKYLKQLKEIDDQYPFIYYLSGSSYMQLKQYEKAITEYEKALSIYNHWGAKPGWIYNYTELGNAYHKTGRFNKEKELYEKAQLDFPDDYELIYRQAVLALTIKDSVSANNLIRKYVADRRSNVVADSLIAKKVDEMFSEAGVTNKPGTYSKVSVTSER